MYTYICKFMYVKYEKKIHTNNTISCHMPSYMPHMFMWLLATQRYTLLNMQRIKMSTSPQTYAVRFYIQMVEKHRLYTNLLGIHVYGTCF